MDSKKRRTNNEIFSSILGREIEGHKTNNEILSLIAEVLDNGGGSGQGLTPQQLEKLNSIDKKADKSYVDEQLTSLVEYVNNLVDTADTYDQVPPETSSAAGVRGHYSMDNDYLYLCVDHDNWRRIKIDNF